MKTQAVQVNEANEDERQINRGALNRPDHPRSVEEECLQKEPFFINHYYSHPVGQCCCQQHEMTVRKRETMVQSSITLTYKISENSQKPQQSSEVKVCTSIMHPPTYDTINEQDKRTSHGEIRGPIVEPQLHFAQASVPNQMNTVPLYAVDTIVPPPLMTKKEKEESQTHMVDNTKMPQKDRELLKVVQMAAELLQQQIVLGMHMADMSQQRTDTLIGELIKSHNRRDMDHILNSIPTFNGLNQRSVWTGQQEYEMHVSNQTEISGKNL